MAGDIRATKFWDQVRASASTPDKETIEQSGPFGILKKVGAQLALTPESLAQMMKASPQLGVLLAKAARPEGVLERQAVSGIVTGGARNVLQNPVSTAVGMGAVPTAGYGVAREVAYRTMPSQVMMYARSLMPWYANKAWTRPPREAVKWVKEGAKSEEAFHGLAERSNVASKLWPYDRRASAGLIGSGGWEYGVPKGLEETVGGAFIKRTPTEVHLLDDLRWYLPKTYMEQISGPFKDILRAAVVQPKETARLLKSLVRQEGLSGQVGGVNLTPPNLKGLLGADKRIGQRSFQREDFRNVLEAFVQRFGHAYPIDWRIPR